MKRHLLTTCAALASSVLATTALAAEARPNIVVIFADDMGWSDVGCYGSEIRTPNLDRLAARGVRMTQFYNTARCCPSRATLLTGLYPHQAGVGHMVDNRGLPGYQGRLSHNCVTIAEALRPAGYGTYMSGKWHVGESPEHWPTQRGFDRYFGLISGASSYFKLDTGRQMALDDKPWTPPADGSFYMTGAITDHAVGFINEHRAAAQQGPMFLYVAYTAPHWPLHAKPADIEKYRGQYEAGWDKLRAQRHQRQLEMGLVEAKWELSPRDERAEAWDDLSAQAKADFAQRMAVYAAQMDSMDQGIGRILAALEQHKMLENTVVMFMSDNGGCAEQVNRGQPGAEVGTVESFLAYGRPWSNASNTPFRQHKSFAHEGGISTPLIAAGPGIASGRIVHAPGHLVDIMPTCLELAGASYPGEHAEKPITPVAGESLVPLLGGQAWQRSTPLYWEHQGNRAIRNGDMKLVATFKNEWELYDLKSDRTELHNLAASRPETVAALAAQWDQWAARSGVVDFAEIQARAAAARAAATRPARD